MSPPVKIDHHVQAAGEAASMWFAVFAVNPFYEIFVAIVDPVIGTELLQPRKLLRTRRADDDLCAGELSKLHATSADPAGGSKD